ncbi:MAG: hypothetical protein AYL30_002870 [Candidatus Hecatellales archaeon B24]|nr:MAG: hypothetical protein AYL30_002870 [Candidatus Hecatellales archaeon B24]
MKAGASALLIAVFLFASLTVSQAQASPNVSAGIEDTVYTVSSCVEDIRGLNFKDRPPIELVSREEAASSLNISEWSGWELAQQEYEALYLVPPGVSAKEVLENFYGSALLGYYSVEKKKIIIVEEAEESLNKSVLAHELTHALLDQYYPETFKKEYELTDKDLAISALLEGDAELVEELYTNAVEQGTYQDCDVNFNLASAENYLGVIYIQYFPYFEGYNFVKRLQKQGWEAVNQAYMLPPESTEQVIHPSKYPGEKPVDVEVKGAGFNGWSRLGEDILGEASIFIMFWNQGLTSFPYSVEGRLTCNSPLSDGWAGDRMVVYKKNGEYGYVWLLVWDTEQDASEFLAGYLEMLEEMGAGCLGEVWKVSASDYVAVRQEGEKVTIVNAPSLQQIDEVMMAAGLPIVKAEVFKAKEFGGGLKFTVSLRNLTPEDQMTTAIVQIKDMKGRIVGLSYVSGIIPASSSIGFNTYSLSLEPGAYQAELYLWRSFKDPVSLSPPQSMEVSVSSWLVLFDEFSP